MGVRVRLLGGVSATRDDVPIALGGPRQQLLLALLAWQQGAPTSAAVIAEELWPGRPPPGAATTVRAYVSRLRQALGIPVAASPAGYRLAVEPDTVDAIAFCRSVEQARSALLSGSFGRAADIGRDALRLWAGPPLAGLDTGPLLDAAVAHLVELRVACQETCVDAELALGRHAALLPELRELVREQPLRERFWYQLVLATYRSGQQAAALAAYREIRQLLADELGVEPGRELAELETAILRQELPAAAPSRSNLPAPLGRLIGRERELDELAAAVRRHRLVTVSGVGGVGKTRLALAVAEREASGWAGGAHLIDLTPLADGELVPEAIGHALDVRDAGGVTTASLSAAIASAELLLLMDNCEHLVAACAPVLAELLRRCRNLHVLATSRLPLGIDGESVFALDPLPLPDSADPAGEPAVQLFVERAAAVRRDLPTGASALATISRMCRDLDGLPLAIELAAARTKTFSLEEIESRLDDRLRFLRAWRRVSDPRHRTLHTTMEWSYGLLDRQEQELLRRLAVFAGGATLVAVAEVCCAGDEVAAADLLDRLVDAGLVRADVAAPTRYRMLETVRQYAVLALADDPDEARIRRRHALFFSTLAESSNLSLDALGHGPQRHAIVLPELANLRSALDWATEADAGIAARLLLALENVWMTQALAEATRRFEQVLARAGDLDVLVRARLTRDYGSCLDLAERWDAAEATYRHSRALFAEAGDTCGVANLDYRLGIAALRGRGDVAETRRLWRASLATFRRAGDRVGELQPLNDLAQLDLDVEPERARADMARSRAMAQAIGWEWWAARVAGKLAADDARRGRGAAAEPGGRELVEFAWRTGNRQELLFGLAVLAHAAAVRGERDRALTIWSTVAASEDGPSRHGRFDRERTAAAMPLGPLPPPMTLAEIVEYALGGTT